MARNFSKDFKINAVNLVLENGLKVSAVANQLDLKLQVLYRWIYDYQELGKDAFVGKGHISPQDIEVRKLKKRIE